MKEERMDWYIQLYDIWYIINSARTFTKTYIWSIERI